MPLVPTADADAIKAIDLESFDTAKEQVTAYWNKIVASGMQIELPEAKAVDTFYTNLIYDLIAIDHIGPDYIQTVNKLHYHAFFLRDGADIVHSYDVTGYPEIAKECLEFFCQVAKAGWKFSIAAGAVRRLGRSGMGLRAALSDYARQGLCRVGAAADSTCGGVAAQGAPGGPAAYCAGQRCARQRVCSRDI